MNDNIQCPNCGYEFDADDAVKDQIEAQLRKEFQQRVEVQNAKAAQARELLEQERKVFEEKKNEENKLFQERLQKQLIEERKKLNAEAQNEVALKLKALEEENEQRKNENQRLKTQEIELLKQQKQIQEEREQMQLEVEKAILERSKTIEEKARIKEREAFDLEKLKYEKQLEDQHKLVEEMKRKAEQGSMQLQGEIQELALEALLREQFPFDEIQEVPKGIRGADSIQVVRNAQQQVCGSIVYESKRTKHFAGDWIDKLKQDQIACKADIAVIVTQTYPSDMHRFGEKNGVYICSFHELKPLAYILRQILIQKQSVALSESNKGEKMELLYDYLTSSEFRQNIERIVENYDNMTAQLNQEKRAMHKIWKQREKQIWSVQENVSALFGSIKGIAGNSLPNIQALELPGIDDDNN